MLCVGQVGKESVKSTGATGYLLWRSIYLSKQVTKHRPLLGRLHVHNSSSLHGCTIYQTFRAIKLCARTFIRGRET